MFRQALCTLFLMSALAFSASCGIKQDNPTPASAPNMANPASVYCEQNGGKLELKQDSAGGAAGMCVFRDGSRCDEWAYFRGECKPGEKAIASEATSPSARTTPASTPSAAFDNDGWRVYRNIKVGYSLSYPPEATIDTDDSLRTITITGPLVKNDHWPMIYFNHPSDRQDYRPPAGVALEKWLTEHNLLQTGGKLGEARLPDLQIAGTSALHTRLARSPQTFALDRYYFAKSQQLYNVVILHTGDKEDWGVYNHFLASIRFAP